MFITEPVRLIGAYTMMWSLTGDERYAWLNNVQAIGIGTVGPTGPTYEVYALS